MTKTALIVDDSRLARHVLREMLLEHELAVDTAPSAEVALEYLKQQRPDVIFMDHMMPGMDGFEALDAIKANPATATIPVMMYTSQKGELYVGQARALGAFGVLPKGLKPVEVANVLRSLHLIPEESAADRRTEAAPRRDEEERGRARELLEELLYQQRQELRADLRAWYQRLATDLRTNLPTQRSGRGWRHLTTSLAAGLALVAAGASGYLYVKTNQMLRQSDARAAQLIQPTAELGTEPKHDRGAVDALPEDPRAVLDALEWAVNQGGRYAFGAVPLDEDRARIFGVLLNHLRRVDFDGTVLVDVHSGRYCMNYTADGMLDLAPAEQPAALCEQVGWPEAQARRLGSQETVAFANAVGAATRDTAIQLKVVTHGSTEPVVEYPSFDYGLTAGEWNAIADRNNRVNVRLLPQSDTYLSSISVLE
jgi:CheY-like chemotaxis protein